MPLSLTTRSTTANVLLHFAQPGPSTLISFTLPAYMMPSVFWLGFDEKREAQKPFFTLFSIV